jgi:hypothetical protein
VAKGARWTSEIAKELEASRIGILVLTAENQDAPWLLFEAGALAKNLDRSKVCPLLFGGLEPTDVKGPLVQFQAARFDAEDMKRLVKMMNTELGDTALAADVLDSVFEMWWPRLAEHVSQELEKHDTGKDGAARSERDILEELLGLTRSLTREGRPRRFDLDHPAFDELAHGLIQLMRLLRGRPIDDETAKVLRHLFRPLEYLARHGVRRHSTSSIRHLLLEAEELLLTEGKARPTPEPGTAPSS